MQPQVFLLPYCQLEQKPPSFLPFIDNFLDFSDQFVRLGTDSGKESRLLPRCHYMVKHHSVYGQKMLGHVELNIKPEQKQLENLCLLKPNYFQRPSKESIRFALHLRACGFDKLLFQRSQSILPPDLSLSRQILCSLNCCLFCVYCNFKLLWLRLFFRHNHLVFRSVQMDCACISTHTGVSTSVPFCCFQ